MNTVPMLVPRALQPPSVLLLGDAGAGKSWSLATLVEAGLELFVLSTEPNGMDSVLDSLAEKKLPIDKVHWHAVSPSAPGWDALMDVAKKVNTMSYSEIAELKSGISKPKMDQWMNLLLSCKDFVDDRTGQHYGDVTEWGPDRALVIDSLSGLNKMAREYVVGLKPNLHQGEWGTAMSLEEGLIWQLCANRRCFFVLTAHLDRNVDEITQSTKLMVKALGNKLAPDIPKNFSEVVLAKRGTDKTPFLWSTADMQTTVKNRALAFNGELPPTFVPIVEAHRRRLAAAAAEVKTS